MIKIEDLLLYVCTFGIKTIHVQIGLASVCVCVSILCAMQCARRIRQCDNFTTIELNNARLMLLFSFIVPVLHVNDKYYYFMSRLWNERKKMMKMMTKINETRTHSGSHADVFKITFTYLDGFERHAGLQSIHFWLKWDGEDGKLLALMIGVGCVSPLQLASWDSKGYVWASNCRKYQTVNVCLNSSRIMAKLLSQNDSWWGHTAGV